MRDGSKSDPSVVPRPPEVSIIILRSFCVGIAAVVAAFFVWMFGVLLFAIYLLEKAHPAAGGEVGIDLVTLVRNSPISAKVLALVAFVIGFGFGVRYFSRPPAAAKVRT